MPVIKMEQPGRQSDVLTFDSLKVVSVLESTHQETTVIHLAKLKDRLVVCKAIKKSYFDDSKKMQHLKNERETLQYFSQTIPSIHPPLSNINHLICTFKDQTNIYFLLEPAFGLPLHKLMRMTEVFDPLFVSMIVTQIALILEEFHKEGFIYRDIKASNFVVDACGKVVMIDMGKAKRINKEKTLTLCGTQHAIPPEVISAGGKYAYSYEFDHYGFGVLLYELLVGKAPFGYENSNPHLHEDVENGLMPEHLEMIKDDFAADLITKLLNPPEHRLGRHGGFREILQHPYFEKAGIDSIKEIMSGENNEKAKSYNFKEYQSEIEDFGVEEGRYDQIQPTDPFYGF